jgi:hypothetical protein
MEDPLALPELADFSESSVEKVSTVRSVSRLATA